MLPPLLDSKKLVFAILQLNIEIVVTHRRRIFSVALENVARKFVSSKSAVVQPNFVSKRKEGIY